jgi:hypothetical protein
MKARRRIRRGRVRTALAVCFADAPRFRLGRMLANSFDVRLAPKTTKLLRDAK